MLCARRSFNASLRARRNEWSTQRVCVGYCCSLRFPRFTIEDSLEMQHARNHRSNQRSSTLVVPVAASLALALGLAGVASAQSAPDAGARRPDAGAPSTADAGAAPANRHQVEIAADPAAYTGPAPFFNVSTPRVSAGLTAPAIQRVFNRQKAPLLDCYKRLLAVAPQAQGRIEIHLEVIAGGTGIVDRVHFTPHRNTSFERCVQNALGSFTWANPRGAPSTQIDQAIEIAPTPPARPGRR
jgi:hypothetical protein